MDALALLCTLHADGPATLVRLRSADCTTLEDVIASDLDTLAMLLRSSRLAAGRFQKEARQLHERLGLIPAGASLESSEGRSIPARASAAPAAADRSRAPRRSSGTPPPAVPAPEPPRTSAPSPLARVLSAWREADAVEPAPKTTTHESDAIPVAAIDGMDAETAQALAQAGVRDLRALAAADALALSRATNLAYSKISRLRALARRQATDAPPVATSKIERLSPSERPAAHVEPLIHLERDFVLEPAARDEGVGGPFA